MRPEEFSEEINGQILLTHKTNHYIVSHGYYIGTVVIANGR